MRVMLSVKHGELSDAYGERHAAWYRDHPSKLSSHGMERDPVKLALWRKCECAVCVGLGLDPLNALDWTDGPDDGFDVPWLGLRIDVKGTVRGHRLLCYPANKVKNFATHRFDLLVLVIADAPVFEIAGWRSKAGFRVLRQIALNHPHLDDGTWFIDRNQLQSIGTLLRIATGEAA